MTTQQTTKQRGHAALFIVIAIVVVAGGVAAWQYVQSKQQNPKTAPSTANEQAAPQTTPQASVQDPAEGGKYLVISEWGVRVALPENVQGKASYLLGDVMADPDGNNIQGAKILLAASLLPGSVCATKDSSFGAANESGAQFIRSETAKPFNAARYRWTFKENILADGAYSYHLNYLTPDCVGSGNAALIESLHSVLDQLHPIEQ